MRIEIPSDCEKINVLFSGGMDSSILLYLLHKEVQTQNKNIVINTYTMPTANATQSVVKIEKWFTSRNFSFTNRLLYKNYNIRELVENILLTEGGYVYTGCNKVLIDEFTPTVYIKNDTPPWRGPPFNERHIRPFIDMDKKEVMKLYIKENIMDLLTLTRSCGIKNKDGVEKCGGCYFCMERQWAADLLNVDDVLL